MSLRPNGFTEIPAETSQVARAAFPKGCLVMRVRDALGPLFTDEQFSELFAARGRPAWSPARLALVLVLGVHRGPHRPAGRRRGASTAGLEPARWTSTFVTLASTPRCLSGFRGRLLAGGQAERLLTLMLGSAARAWPAARGRAGSAPTPSRSVWRSVTYTGCKQVIKTLRAALEALAIVAPSWLGGQIPPEWTRRCGQRGDDWRLPRPSMPAPTGHSGWSGRLVAAGGGLGPGRAGRAGRRGGGAGVAGDLDPAAPALTTARFAGATSRPACRPAAG
jgi:hypothetical protein